MAQDDDTFNVIVTNVEYEKMLNDSRQQMSELRAANEKINSLEHQKKAMIRQIEQHNDDINARDQDIKRITSDCLRLKKDKLSLQETIEDFEDNQEGVLKERDQLKSNTQRLVSDIKQITQKLQNQMQQTKKLSFMCEELTKNIKCLEEKPQPPKINLTDSWTETEGDSMKGHTSTRRPFSKNHLEETNDHDQRKSSYHHSTSQQHPPSSVLKKKQISSIQAFQNDISIPEQNLQLIDSMNDKISGLEMELKKMGGALSKKRLQNQLLVEKLKQTQKDLDDTKLLNQNIGKQLSEADREFSEVVEKLQTQLEAKEKALVQKDILLEESKGRVDKRADNLNRQLTLANQFIEKKDIQCNKLKAQQIVNSKKILELMQQQEASKKTISDLRMHINNKSSEHSNKAPVHFLEKIYGIMKSCTSNNKFEELKEEIQRELNLQAEYQKLITDADTKNKQLQKENFILKRQLDGSQHMINEIMDANSKRDAEAAVLKSDIERLEAGIKQSKVTNVETQNRYQIALSELREELRKSERGQDQLKSIVKMMESKDDYIDYYLSVLRTKLKEQEPRVITRIIHDDLDEFIKKLVKQIPGKML